MICDAGACACGPGTTACGSPPQCVNTQRSTGNCGACGAKCPNGQHCSAGMCMP
jgi:hypothetical protein